MKIFKTVMAIALAVLFILSITLNLILFKKYKDIIDYFNQDSQLTVERFGNIEDRLNSLKIAMDEIVPKVKSFTEDMSVIDGKINSSIAEQNKIKKDLLAQIQVLNDDLLKIRATLRERETAPVKQEAPKEETQAQETR